MRSIAVLYSFWSLCAALNSQVALTPSDLVLEDDFAETKFTLLPHKLGRHLLGLHKHLVEIESISGNELKVGQWLEAYLTHRNFSVERQEVEPGRYNVYAWGGSADEKGKVEVLASSHIDTVPPFIPYSYDVEKGTIAGRGSVDAKASVASQITAVLSLLEESKIDRRKVGFLYVVGEEVDGGGMEFFSASTLNKRDYTAVVFGEPTEQQLCEGHKGVAYLNITVEGRAAHSGYPWLGLSANDVLIRALTVIKEMESGNAEDGLPSDDTFGNTTVNVGRIDGGVANNVVAEHASAQLLFRVAAATPDKIFESVKSALEPLSDYTARNDGKLHVQMPNPGTLPTHLDCDIEGFDCTVVNYGTDVPHLHNLAKSTKRYLYGPGTILVAHGPREAVKIKELEQAVVDYKKIIAGIFDKHVEVKENAEL